jgi:hypothetical protein
MTSFGILVKSFQGDLVSARRLFASIDRFNVESLPVWVVVPEADVSDFEPLVGGSGQVLPESQLGHHLVNEPVAGIRPGYINQEIVKLAFWELGLVRNYLPVDSDAVFLREFTSRDFMYSTDVPYTVLLEDRDLQVDPDYYATHWRGREQTLRAIQAEIGLDDARLLTCHGHQVLSRVVLESLRDDFLAPRGWTYAEMLERGPYEFSWYNFWLQKSKVVPIELREPYFKVIHSRHQHAELAIRGITSRDIARGYLGVIINSNFSRSDGNLSHEATRADTLATYLTWSELGAAASAKMRKALSSRFMRSEK